MKLAYAIEVAPDLGEARLPAMMLQPLVDYALDRWYESPNVARELRIASETGDDRLRLVVSSDHHGEPTAIHGPVFGKFARVSRRSIRRMPTSRLRNRNSVAARRSWTFLPRVVLEALVDRRTIVGRPRNAPARIEKDRRD